MVVPLPSKPFWSCCQTSFAWYISQFHEASVISRARLTEMTFSFVYFHSQLSLIFICAPTCTLWLVCSNRVQVHCFLVHDLFLPCLESSLVTYLTQSEFHLCDTLFLILTYITFFFKSHLELEKTVWCNFFHFSSFLPVDLLVFCLTLQLPLLVGTLLLQLKFLAQ